MTLLFHAFDLAICAEIISIMDENGADSLLVAVAALTTKLLGRAVTACTAAGPGTGQHQVRVQLMQEAERPNSLLLRGASRMHLATVLPASSSIALTLPRIGPSTQCATRVQACQTMVPRCSECLRRCAHTWASPASCHRSWRCEQHVSLRTVCTQALH